MFKNRRLEVRLAKDAQERSPEEVAMSVDPHEIADILKDLGKKAFVGTLIIMGTSFVLGTTHDVVVTAVDNKTKKDPND